MINFSTTAARPRTEVVTQVPVVQETITIKAVPQAVDRNGGSTSNVTWQKLRDYVTAQVEATSGPFPRDVRKENTIFMAFMARWPEQAMDIARFAFESCEGIWKGAPVSVVRFHRTSDSYFAEPIAKLINP